MGNCRAHDVLSYVRWVESLLIREAHRLDPRVEWQRDLSWDEIAAMVGVNLRGEWELAPGEWVGNVELAVALYWPGEPPAYPREELSQSGADTLGPAGGSSDRRE